MSMSTRVIGFAPPDEKWQAMKRVWDACEAGGIKCPDEVLKFFDYGESAPDPAGVEIKIPVREWHNDNSSGFEIDVSSIPAHVKVLRFYNSW